MRLHILAATSLSVAAFTGCATSNVSWQPPRSHPANAEAGDVAFAPPPNVLTKDAAFPDTQGESAPMMDQDGEHHHGVASAPDEVGAPAMTAAYPLDTCIVSGAELGTMGEPVIYSHEGMEVRFCCNACVKKFEADPEKYLPPLREANKDHVQHQHAESGGGR